MVCGILSRQLLFKNNSSSNFFKEIARLLKLLLIFFSY